MTNKEKGVLKKLFITFGIAICVLFAVIAAGFIKTERDWWSSPEFHAETK
jgi:hypothetical protein